MTSTMNVNTIYNIDCLDGIAKIPSGSVKSIITDPPYFQGLTHNGKRGTMTDLALCRPFFEALFKEFDRVLADDGTVYFFTDWRGYAFYYPLLSEAIPVRNMLVWDKMGGPGNNYAFHHEIIIYATKNSIPIGGSNIIRLAGFSGGAKRTNGAMVHPTQKPLEIITKIVEDSTKPGDLVLDCFAGSGTTAVVCKNTGRQYICFELQQKYCDIAAARLAGGNSNADNPTITTK